jgi:hypothetical protein
MSSVIFMLHETGADIFWIKARKKARKIKKEKEECYKIFRTKYPNSLLCPGKENSNGFICRMCWDCKIFSRKYKFIEDEIPEEEKKVKGFNFEDHY